MNTKGLSSYNAQFPKHPKESYMVKRPQASHGTMKKERIAPTEPKKFQNNFKITHVKDKYALQSIQEKPIKDLSLDRLKKLADKSQSQRDLQRCLVELTRRCLLSNKNNNNVKLQELKDNVSTRLTQIYESSSSNQSRENSIIPTNSGKTTITEIIKKASEVQKTKDQQYTYDKVLQIQDEGTKRDFLKAFSPAVEKTDIQGLYEALKEYTELITSYQDKGVKIFYSNQELQLRFDDVIEIGHSNVSDGSYDFVVPLRDPEKVFLLKKDSGHTAVATSENAINDVLFPKGKPVLYAGTMRISNSAIEHWTNSSGHYKPDPINSDGVKQNICLLREKGNLLSTFNEKFECQDVE